MSPMNSVESIPFHPAPDRIGPSGPTRREKIADVAQKFEAILLGQLLKTMRESANVFSDDSDSPAGSDMMGEFMDEHLVQVLARGGGIGLGRMIASQLGRVAGDGGDTIPNRIPQPARRLPGTVDRSFRHRRPPAAGNGGSFKPIIRRAARRYGLDPELIRAVIDQESGGDTTAVSPRGAKGLMQLMDETAREMGVSRPFDPEENIFGGARYLKKQLDRWRGDLEKALASYNAGPAAVSRYDGVPPFAETIDYVRRITARVRGASGHQP